MKKQVKQMMAAGAVTASMLMTALTALAAPGWNETADGWQYELENGKIAEEKWLEIDGKWYYFGEYGNMLTGWQELDDGFYYLGKDGSRHTGWLLFEGKWYYLDAKGRMMTGWTDIGENTYFFFDSGEMAVNTEIDGYGIDQDGVRYQLKETEEPNPVIEPGWHQEAAGWRYADKNGNYVSGVWETIQGKAYYFREDGYMATGWTDVEGEGRYYFKEDGSPYKGWMKQEEKLYYFGENSSMSVGWDEIDSKYYYFDKDGAMVVNTVVDGYWIGEDGVRMEKPEGKEGWRTDKEGRKYVKADGSYAVWSWVEIDGFMYYFGGDGYMLTKWQYIGDAKYYLGTDGIRHTGWLELNNKRYYLDENGVMQTGWTGIDGKTYYFGADGKMAVNVTVEGQRIGKDGIKIEKEAAAPESGKPENKN